MMPSDNDEPMPNASTENEIEAAKTTKEGATFYLMGLRINGRRDRPDFYTFLIEQNGQMLPLIAQDQIVLFTRLELANTALQAANIAVEMRDLSYRNVYLIDVSQALFLLQSQSADEHKILANMLDLFARTLTGLGVGVPPVFADALIAFGNYVDQNAFYGDFIAQPTITRHRLIDATRWCLGTIFSLARIITEE